MKKLFILLLVFASTLCRSQTPSDYSVPDELTTFYARDIKTLALKRMEQYQSPDLAFVRIPQTWQDTIAHGLAAILQSGLEEADSVFNSYCVHNNTGEKQIYNGLLIQVDINYPWTQAWQNLNTITGNAYIDTLTSRYDLEISQFFDWSFGDYALLHTDSLWNIYALIDSLIIEPGVLGGEADALIGSAGRITYEKYAGVQYFDFWFQFNDCFDGCDNYRKWMFKVQSDCTVEYLGFEDFGFFGIEPLPGPLDCNIYTSVPKTPYVDVLTVFPNPAINQITVQLKNFFVFPVEFAIYTPDGKAVLQGKLTENNQKVDVSTLRRGLYILRLNASDVAHVRFLVY